VKVFEEIGRVLKPNGRCCVSFSNRMFPTKAILAWRMSSNEDHFNLVSQYFKKTEKFDELKVEKLVEENGYYDPLFAVIGKKEE
jgi:ubiquinone/menaquinone biosynthesis C-methylase UbiE